MTFPLHLTDGRHLQNNRWRKRALALVPLNYPVKLIMKHPVFISIYDKDGTVAVSHGGVEMGQGLNTKVSRWDRNSTPRLVDGAGLNIKVS